MQTLNIPDEITDAYTLFLKRRADILYIVCNMTDD